MSEMMKISIKELAKFSICPGHLYLQTSSERQFYLMKPGMYIDKNFLNKHLNLQTEFELNPIISVQIQDEFFRLLKEFNYLHFEMDIRKKCRELIIYFSKIFTSESHFLNFAIPCFQHFNNLHPAYLQVMSDVDVYLLRKAIYSAAFSVLISFCNGIYHPLMVKDIYNLTLSLDVGLCRKNYSYFVAQACNEENKNPGNGMKWLQQEKATPEEIDIFLSHPNESYKLYEQGKIKLLHRELAQIILYQHELSNGKGFPRGIKKGLVSSWESVVILADSLVGIEKEFDFENRVIEFLYQFESKKLKNLPLNKIYQRLCHSLKGLENEVQEDLTA